MVRVSTVKGFQESDGPELQTQRGLACAQQKFGLTQTEVLVMQEVRSGRDEDRPCLTQALDLVAQHQITILLVNDIDRLTRAGVSHYEKLKGQFKALGCEIYDVKGIIQPEQNVLTGSGGAFGADFSYDWSVFSASEKAELIEAQMAKDEARKILGRVIPAQIQCVQKGHTIRVAPYGFRNVKILDERGKPQPSLKPDDSEAFFVHRIFEGMATGVNIRDLCDDLNAQGFRTRRRRIWNADRSAVVGSTGGQVLLPKRVHEMIQRPIYAGFVCEKWTHGLPVRASHEGLVSVALWNQVNQGRWRLVQDPSSATGWRKEDERHTKKNRPYKRSHSDFPFKKLVCCPKCGAAPWTGNSRNRSGNYFGYYYCRKGHKQISYRNHTLHNAIRAYLQDLRFTPELTARLEEHIRHLWAQRVGDLNQHLIAANTELAELREEADAILRTIRFIQNPDLIKRIEADYEDLQTRIKLREAKRDEKEFSEADLNRAIKWVKHFLEHLDDLVMDTDNEGLRTLFWSLIFTENPTFNEIITRTAPLSPLVRVKDDLKSGKSGVVEQEGLNKNKLLKELEKWFRALSPHEQLMLSGLL